MSDVQKKDVLQQNDANPIPIGQYTISKMLGIKTVDISPKYNSEKVYSKLFEELKGKELDAYQEKYRFYQKKYQFDNEKYFFIDRFCKLLDDAAQKLPEPQKCKILENITDKNIHGLSMFIEDKCNEVVNDAAAKVANVYEQCKKEIEQLEEEIEEEIKEFEEKMEQLKKEIHELVRISWLVKKKRPSTEKDRLALYKISFAFNLSMEDHIKLFTHVFKLKPYLRTPAEFCLTYAKEHNMEYSEAVNLYCKYFSKRIKSGNIPASETKSAENYSGTRTLMKEVLDNESDNDHEKFICELLSMRSKFCEASQKLQKRILDIAKQYGFKKSSLNNFLTLEKYCHYRWTDKETTDEKFKLFFISVDSSFKNNKDNKPIRSKTVLQLRKIYIICRTYQLWNNFENKDINNSFTGFCNILSLELIKMNLPQLDYLDDFDRGIILATAYRLHNNTTKALGDLICEIVKE